MEYSVETVLQQIPGVSCLDGDEGSLFVGTQDGQLLHFVIHKDDPESDSLDYTYLLASRQEAAGRRAPVAIVVLHSVALVAVLANEQLSFYTLPEFAPASELRVIKDVQGVIQNSTLSDRIDSDGLACLTVFTKKKIRQIRVSRQIVKLTKEVEYVGCLAACQRGPIVCAATKSSYDLVDLDKKAKIPLIPVVQGETNPTGPQYDIFLPRITSVTTNEFLLASGSPESATSMGMFITLEGEITRGTLMYDDYPLQILAEGQNIVTLLSNHTIEIHDLQSQARLQVLQAEDATKLYRSSHSIPVVSSKHLDIIIRKQNLASDEQLNEKPFPQDLNEARKNSDILSSLLISNFAGVSSLITPTRLLTIDSKMNAGDLQAALSDAEQLARDTPPSHAERLFHEMAFIHQKAGLLSFGRMLFDDAADNFKKGNIDPRILISYFPEFESRAQSAQVYGGLLHTIKTMPDVDSIIRSQLQQSVDDEATLSELESIVKSNAIEVLRRYLTRFQEKRGLASTASSEDMHCLFSVVDSTLLRILLQMDPDEVSAKMQEFLKEDVEDPVQIGKILSDHSKWIYLAQLSAKAGNHAQVLGIWRKLVLGDLIDVQYRGDGMTQIQDYLVKFGDDETFWEFGLWLLKRQPEVGIPLLMNAIDARVVNFEARDVLDALRIDQSVSIVFRQLLEHLVTSPSTKQNYADLGDEILMLQAKDLLGSLDSDAITTFLATSISQYQSLHPPKVPYLTFVSESLGVDCDEELLLFIALRTKLIDMLQNLVQYDAQAILDVILQKKDLLLAERILLYGRLSNHAESINLMVHDLQDFDSAEVYCYHGGISLSQINIASDKSGTVQMRKKLFPLLFLEYLKLQDYSLQFIQGSQLLNRWGNYMDLAETLALIPDDWSLELVSNFLLSALSKLAGDKREAQIKRSLARASLQRQAAKNFVQLTS